MPAIPPSRRSGDNPLAKYLDKKKREKAFATYGELAKRLGMFESHFSRAVQDNGRLTVEQCMLLARELKTDIPMLLRLAGRRRAAEVLESERADRDVNETLSFAERELIRLWRTAHPAMRDVAQTALSALSAAGARAARTPGSRRQLQRDLAEHSAAGRRRR